MHTSSIGLTEARRQFTGIVNRVMYQGDSYIIEKQGKPVAAVVPLEIYEQWRERRNRFLSLLREVQAKNIDADPDEVMQDILEAQQAVRAESIQVER
jgi:prevent-host-death family protein